MNTIGTIILVVVANVALKFAIIKLPDAHNSYYEVHVFYLLVALALANLALSLYCAYRKLWAIAIAPIAIIVWLFFVVMSFSG
jgi:hypothetical protein